MEARNLKRYYLAHQALYNFNRKSGYNLTYGEMKILLTIYLLGDGFRRSHKTGIYNLLKASKHSLQWPAVSKGIDRLVELQFVQSIQYGKSKQYHLSCVGRNVLMDIERRLRNQRHDRIGLG